MISRLRRRKRGLFSAQLEHLPIWLTGTMLGIASFMILALLTFILIRGLSVFWPQTVWQLTLRDSTRYLGTVHRVEPIPESQSESGQPLKRTLLRISNRDLYGNDFVWINDADIQVRSRPKEAAFVERLEWGPFIGFVAGLTTPQGSVSAQDPPTLWKSLRGQMKAAKQRLAAMRRIEKRTIGDINTALENQRLAMRRVEFRHQAQTPEGQARIRRAQEAIRNLEARYAKLSDELRALREQDQAYRVTLRSIEGKTKELPISALVRVHQPNRIGFFGKLGVYFDRLGEFVFGQPREANSEGGVAPAIFGTVLMTLLMSLVVVPLGVLGALYLHEYAKQGFLVSCVRIAVNNLAGVPSIVFGVFGLGFFCYTVGGTIDTLFFPERLPTPTFGGGGILWAALTLALLTVPVVIVATEEALAAVPNGLRAASLACGATKFQTICRVVLPAALPGILTGAILAMARGAGEVAPLMITGVVKLAPELPFDHIPPFLHLERKFMHLGFHIYDVGFQSPNVEASKPMVYMTTLLLLGIIVCLNLAAMQIRGRLRENFRGAEV